MIPGMGVSQRGVCYAVYLATIQSRMYESVHNPGLLGSWVLLGGLRRFVLCWLCRGRSGGEGVVSEDADRC